jgi:hypothetical protein
MFLEVLVKAPLGEYRTRRRKKMGQSIYTNVKSYTLSIKNDMSSHGLHVDAYTNDLKKFVSDCLYVLSQSDVEFADSVCADINRLILLFGDVYKIPTSDMCRRVRNNCTKNKNICTMCKSISTNYPIQIYSYGSSIARDSEYNLIRDECITTVILFADYFYRTTYIKPPPSDTDLHIVESRQSYPREVLLSGLFKMQLYDSILYNSICKVEFPKKVRDPDGDYYEVDIKYVRDIVGFVQEHNVKFEEFLIQKFTEKST